MICGGKFALCLSRESRTGGKSRRFLSPAGGRASSQAKDRLSLLPPSLPPVPPSLPTNMATAAVSTPVKVSASFLLHTAGTGAPRTFFPRFGAPLSPGVRRSLRSPPRSCFLGRTHPGPWTRGKGARASRPGSESQSRRAFTRCLRLNALCRGLGAVSSSSLQMFVFKIILFYKNGGARADSSHAAWPCLCSMGDGRWALRARRHWLHIFGRP